MQARRVTAYPVGSPRLDVIRHLYGYAPAHGQDIRVHCLSSALFFAPVRVGEWLCAVEVLSGNGCEDRQRPGMTGRERGIACTHGSQ